MGMDLDFWRYKENAARDHAKVYRQAACEGRQLEELETLPIDEMLKKDRCRFFRLDGPKRRNAV